MILPVESVKVFYTFSDAGDAGRPTRRGDIDRWEKMMERLYSTDVLAALARPAARYDTRNAELLPNVTPRWHVIEVYPNAERRVAEELVARRFGIFLPESEETIVRRGRKVGRVGLMFPGYIFVFVWDVFRHRSRIEEIAGVVRVMLSITGDPVFLSDEQIDDVRLVENGERPLHFEETKSKRRRRKKRSGSFDIIGARCWSPFRDGLLSVDSGERNQTLQKALGLCS